MNYFVNILLQDGKRFHYSKYLDNDKWITKECKYNDITVKFTIPKLLISEIDSIHNFAEILVNECKTGDFILHKNNIYICHLYIDLRIIHKGNKNKISKISCIIPINSGKDSPIIYYRMVDSNITTHFKMITMCQLLQSEILGWQINNDARLQINIPNNNNNITIPNSSSMQDI